MACYFHISEQKCALGSSLENKESKEEKVDHGFSEREVH